MTTYSLGASLESRSDNNKEAAAEKSPSLYNLWNSLYLPVIKKKYI
jgi:hypothetical protein